MTKLFTRARPRLTYANVVASLALFVALGGTGYAALELPRNSVGSAQIKERAVGSSEIRNRSIRSSDLSKSARERLRGQRGPTGPAGPSGAAFRAAISSGGARVLGNATNSSHQGGTNVYSVEFAQDMTNCVYTAVLASVQAGPQLEQPPAGRITVASGGGNKVIVTTFGVDGTATESPFHLTASC
jgi:hypothetical protein